MLLGFYGLLFELQNPGAILPGVVGGIALILAFLALSTLPVNYAGVALIVLAVAFFIAEIKVASHGILTVGGVISMLLGSLMLYDVPESGLRISWFVLGPTVGATAGVVMFAVGAGLRALHRPLTTGAAVMVGQTGVVRTALDPEGQVLVGGELWGAVTRDGPVPPGEHVEIVSVDGLTLTVTRTARRA